MPPEEQTAPAVEEQPITVEYDILDANAVTGFVRVKFKNPFRKDEEDEVNVDRERSIPIGDCFNEDGTPNADALRARIEDHRRAQLHRFKIARDQGASQSSVTPQTQQALNSVLQNILTSPPPPPPAPPAPEPEDEEEIIEEEDLDEEDEELDPPPSGGGL